MRLIAFLMMLFLASLASAGAESAGTTATTNEIKRYIYEWTDTKGNVHITDDFGSVPERYRDKTRKIDMPRGQEVGPGQQAGEEAGSPASPAEQEAALKAAWQQRMRDWKRRLADAQKRYQALDKKRVEALEKWGGLAAAASGHLEGRAEAARIAQEMKEVQKDIDEAKDMVETVIPEEARRAGVPPGWLRE